MNEQKTPIHDHCFMCSRVLAEWLPALALHRQTMKIKKGRLVFKEGDKVTGIYFVLKGLIKVHKAWGSKELILRFAQQGTVLGHRGISSLKDTYPISATALEDSLVCYVPMDFFNKSLTINHQFTHDLMMFLADELRQSEEKMLDINLKSVKSRLAKGISLLKRNFGLDADGFITFAINKNDLAAYAGTTYETSFRVMNELQADGLIEVNGKRIKVLDEEKLLIQAEDKMP